MIEHFGKEPGTEKILVVLVEIGSINKDVFLGRVSMKIKIAEKLFLIIFLQFFSELLQCNDFGKGELILLIE